MHSLCSRSDCPLLRTILCRRKCMYQRHRPLDCLQEGSGGYPSPQAQQIEKMWTLEHHDWIWRCGRIILIGTHESKLQIEIFDWKLHNKHAVSWEDSNASIYHKESIYAIWQRRKLYRSDCSSEHFAKMLYMVNFWPETIWRWHRVAIRGRGPGGLVDVHDHE